MPIQIWSLKLKFRHFHVHQTFDWISVKNYPILSEKHRIFRDHFALTLTHRPGLTQKFDLEILKFKIFAIFLLDKKLDDSSSKLIRSYKKFHITMVKMVQIGVKIFNSELNLFLLNGPRRGGYLLWTSLSSFWSGW